MFSYKHLLNPFFSESDKDMSLLLSLLKSDKSIPKDKIKLNDLISDFTLSDAILLITYQLGCISPLICTKLLSGTRWTEGSIRSRLSIMARPSTDSDEENEDDSLSSAISNSEKKRRFKDEGTLIVVQNASQNNFYDTTDTVRFFYFLSDQGLKRVKKLLHIKSTTVFQTRNAIKCRHDYYSAIALLQLLWVDNFHKKQLDPESFSTDFMTNIDETPSQISFTRSKVLRAEENTVESSLNQSGDILPDYIVAYSRKEKRFAKQGKSGVFHKSESGLLEEYSSGVPEELGTYDLLLEQDMSTERIPVLINKMAKYSSTLLLQKGDYRYMYNKIVFSCHGNKYKKAAQLPLWYLSLPELRKMIKYAQDLPDGLKMTIGALGESIRAGSPILPKSAYAAYQEIAEFYRYDRTLTTGYELLTKVYENRQAQRCPMLLQRDGNLQSERCRKKLIDCYRQILSMFEKGDVEEAQLIRSAFLNGLAAYFIPTILLANRSDGIFHNSLMLASAANALFQAQLKPLLPGFNPAYITYNILYPAEFSPQLEDGTFFHFRNAVMIHEEGNPNAIAFILGFEDLSDLSSWIRIKQYYHYFPLGCLNNYQYGVSSFRFVVIADTREDIINFCNETKLYGTIESGETLFTNGTKLCFILRSALEQIMARQGRNNNLPSVYTVHPNEDGTVDESSLLLLGRL